MRLARLLLIVIATAAATAPVVACEEPEPRSAANAPRPGRVCGKIDPELARELQQADEGTRVRVVVELSNAPRARDVLQAGVADCISDPAIAGQGSWSGGVPWGEREMAIPSNLPVTCVGWATHAQLAKWCEDPAVRSVDPWR